MTTTFTPSLVEQVGWVLLHSVWQFAAVGLALFVALFVFRRASATVRYLAGLLAIGTVVAAPIVTWAMLPHSDVAAETPAAPQHNVLAASTGGTMPGPEPTPERHSQVTDVAAAAANHVDAKAKTPVETTPWQVALERRLRPWLRSIVLAWCIGVLAFALRPLLSWRRLRQLQRNGLCTVPGDVESALQSVADRLGVRRAVSILQSTLVQVPVVVGYLRPAILLPVGVLAELPPSQLEAIIAHELAHVRRHDFLVNLLQTLVETVFFFHPVVWWMSRQVRNERENCCDDMAVAALGDRAAYSRALLAIEELRGPSLGLAVGAADGSLLSRVRRLLLKDRDRRVPRLAATGGIAAGLALLLLAGVWAVLCINVRGAGADGLTYIGGEFMSAEEQDAWDGLQELNFPIYGVERPHLRRHLEMLERGRWPNADQMVELRAQIARPVRSADFWNVPAEAWPLIAHLGSLKRVSVVASDMRGEAFQQVARMKNLRRVEIANSKCLPPDVALLKDAIGLEHLDVMFSTFEESSTKRLELIGEMTAAERTWADRYGLSHSRMEHIIEAAILTDRMLEQLSGLTKLKTLKVINSAVSERGVQALSEMAELESLELQCIDLTPQAARVIGRLPSLRSFRYANATDGTLAAFAGLPHLEDLELWAGEVTDEGIQHLLNIQSLQKLALRGSRVSDAGLLELTNLPLLKLLDLRYATGAITPQGIEAFRAQKPDCQLLVGTDDNDAAHDHDTPHRHAAIDEAHGAAAVPTVFEPFDCLLVDAATGQPIPGDGFTIHILFKQPATADAPEDTIDNLIWGPKATSRFQFLIPERSFAHPDRGKLIVQWGVGHPDYELLSPPEQVPLAQILRDDPKSARDTFRRIAMQRKKPQADTMPQSARIVVTYNIRDAEPQTRIYVQDVNGKGDIGTEEVGLTKFNLLQNGGTLTLPDLDSGDYQVARYRQVEIGGVGMSRIHTGLFLDRHRFKLQAGETKTIDFVRPNGKPVSGRVEGVKKFGLDKVIVCVGSENATDPESLNDLNTTIYDARHSDAEGRFTTEPLSPGKYVILVEAYAPFRQEELNRTGIPEPRYRGAAKVTVPENGAAPEVEVTLRDTQAPQATDTAAASRAAAIAAIEKLGGKVQYDDNSPDKPVIAVSFFEKPDVVDADLASLEPLTSLLEVVLTGTGVTDAGLEHLKGLSNLGSLALTKTRVTDAGVFHFEDLSRLEILELHGTRITDAGLAHLAGLTRLNMLLLSETGITDEGLVHLQTLGKLNTLDLGGTAVTDAGLEILSGLTSLRDLRLGRTMVSDAGLEHLLQFKSLKTLVLDWTRISPGGLNRLRAALPDCRIYPQPAADLQSSIRFNVFDQSGQKAIAKFRVMPGYRRMVGDPDQPTWQENDARTGRDGELLWPLADLLADETAFLVAADGYKPQVWTWVRKADGAKDLFFTLAEQPTGSLLLDCRISGGAAQYTFHWNLFKTDEPRPGVLLDTRDVKAANGQQTEFRNMIPGMYQLWRVRPIRFPDFTRQYALDYREIQVSAEKQTATRFSRGAGHRVRGRIVGLETLVGPFSGGGDSQAPGRPSDDETFACVLVRAADAPDPEFSQNGFRDPTYDVAPVHPDGRFVTEPLEPGTYKLYSHAYRRLTEQERVRPVDIELSWVGSATVTVSADGEPEEVEIELNRAGTDESPIPRQQPPSDDRQPAAQPGDDPPGGESQSPAPGRDDKSITAGEQKKVDQLTLTVEARFADGVTPRSLVARLWRRAEEGAEASETMYDSDWYDPASRTLWREAAWQKPQHTDTTTLRFLFADVAPGEYRVSVHPWSENDWSRADPTPFGASAAVTVTEDSGAQTVPVTIAGDRVLVVHFVDAESREPLDDVPVTLFRSDGLPITTGNGNHGLYGGETGRKTYRGLVPGEYALRIFDRHEDVGSRIAYGPLTERVPFRIDATPESVITVAIPRERLTEQQIEDRWPYWVYGRVSDQNGDPVPDAQITVSTGAGTLMRGGSGKTDADGRFKVHFVGGYATRISPEAPRGVGTQAAIVYLLRDGFVLKDPAEGASLQMSDGPPAADEGDPKSRRIVRPGRPVEINFTLRPASEKP